MAFQKTVNRQYTQGWVGELMNDGPNRAKPARIKNGGAGTVNRIGRAFTVSGDIGPSGPSGNQTAAWIEQQVVVGGAATTVKNVSGNFFGILGIPKHYTLFGGAGDPLAASIDLPDNVEAEFVDMGIMVVEVTNAGSSALADAFNLDVYYASVAAAADTTNNLVAITAADIGKLCVFPTDAVPNAAASKYVKVPNCKLTTYPGALASGASTVVRIQLTN